MAFSLFRLTPGIYFAVCLVVANVNSERYRQHVSSLPARRKSLIHHLARYHVEMLNAVITLNTLILCLNNLASVTLPLMVVQAVSHSTTCVGLASFLNFGVLIVCKVMLTVPSGFVFMFNLDQDSSAWSILVWVWSTSGLIHVLLAAYIVVCGKLDTLPFMYAELLDEAERTAANYEISANWQIMMVMSILMAILLIVSYPTRLFILSLQKQRSASIMAGERLAPDGSLCLPFPDLAGKGVSFKTLVASCLAFMAPIIFCMFLVTVDGDRSSVMMSMVRTASGTAVVVMYGHGKGRRARNPTKIGVYNK